MPKKVLLDAGPLVAALCSEDEWHDWSVEQFRRFDRFVTCDAVLAEAGARLACHGYDQNKVIELVATGALVVDFDTNREASRISILIKKYADFEMDFADACLVVMTERFADSLVVTLDAKDFSVYRRHERQVVPFLAPGK